MRYAVQQANAQLEIGKVRVNLKLTNPSAIALQGTFPCRHGNVSKNGSYNKQYTISVGTAANDGVCLHRRVRIWDLLEQKLRYPVFCLYRPPEIYWFRIFGYGL